MRSIGVVLVAVTVGALSWLGAGGAAADTPLPGVFLWSNSMATFGDHDFCRGNVIVSLSTPPGKRGVVRVTYTSSGFTGEGPGWKRNPKCRVMVGMVQEGPGLNYRERWFPLTFGPSKQRIVRDVVTGSGFLGLGSAPYAVNAPGHILQGYGGTFWTVVP